jgi:hypothetical protein
MSNILLKSCPKCSTSHSRSGKFCSRSCANSRGPRTQEFKDKIILKLTGRKYPERCGPKIEKLESNCFICNTIIYIMPKDKGINTTCKSKECKHLACVNAGKKSAAKRVLRSKNEIKLYEYCKNQFIDVLSNYIIMDGWDADIVIPHLKFAVMWQGPWHYKDMGMTNHSLLQVQNRDKIKRKLFSQNGWKVLEFKDCDYTPESAFQEILVEAAGFEPAK